MKNEIIHNVDNVKVSSNELIISSVLNRNFRKLFENDANLFPMTRNNNRYRIMPYDPNKVYSKNDLVWFVDYYLSPQNEKAYIEEYEKLSSLAAFQEVDIDVNSVKELKNKYYTVSLYLLRSLKNNNTSFPKREIVNMIPMFDASGWKNENEFGTIYTDYFEDFTAYTLSIQLEKMHETVSEMHKFGKLSSYENLDDKVLRTDLSNISPDRKILLYPRYTYQLEEDATILGGWERVWDTGYIEYDIDFQLGNNGSSYQVYNSDGSLRTEQTLEANYFSLREKTGFVSDYDKYDNRRYYYQDNDADIFKVGNDESLSSYGIVQNNVNGKLNVFVGTINFDRRFTFIDTNYCIFTEMFPCVSTNSSNILEPNVNRLVFANKSRQSITAVLIIPTYNGDNPKVLSDNRFKCHVCGRWK